MICYFIKGTEFVDAENYRGFEAKQLVDKDRKIVRENIKKLSKEIGENKNIYLYCAINRNNDDCFWWTITRWSR